jgi:hypothetical protein
VLDELPLESAGLLSLLLSEDGALVLAPLLLESPDAAGVEESAGVAEEEALSEDGVLELPVLAESSDLFSVFAPSSLRHCALASPLIWLQRADSPLP